LIERASRSCVFSVNWEQKKSMPWCRDPRQKNLVSGKWDPLNG